MLTPFPLKLPIPPEVMEEMNKQLIPSLVPLLTRLAEIIKEFHIHEFQMGVGNGIVFSLAGEIHSEESLSFFKDIINEEKNLPADLVEGIEKILTMNYQGQFAEILGMKFNQHRMVAGEIAKVLMASRVRDKESLVRELEALITKLRTQ